MRLHRQCRPRVFYILTIQMRKTTFIAGLLAALYGAAIGIAADTPPTG